jgi:hypothetical protein
LWAVIFDPSFGDGRYPKEVFAPPLVQMLISERFASKWPNTAGNLPSPTPCISRFLQSPEIHACFYVQRAARDVHASVRILTEADLSNFLHRDCWLQR